MSDTATVNITLMVIKRNLMWDRTKPLPKKKKKDHNFNGVILEATSYCLFGIIVYLAYIIIRTTKIPGFCD